MCSSFYSTYTYPLLSPFSTAPTYSLPSLSYFEGFYSFNLVSSLAFISLINLSSFFICGVSFFCFMSSELNLFLTVCSVLLSAIAYSDHFLPPLATLSNRKESSSTVHAPLSRHRTTCACSDRDGSASARGSAFHFGTLLPLTTRTFDVQFRSSLVPHCHAILPRDYLSYLSYQQLIFLITPPSVLASLALNQSAGLEP